MFQKTKNLKALVIGITLICGLFVGTLAYNAASIVQAANTNQPLAMQDHKIKVNKNGETYGSLLYVTEAGQEPDLVQTVGVDGTEGYVKYSDLMGPEVNTPEEAAAYMKEKHGPRMIPLYASDGQTVIGKYKAGGLSTEIPSQEVLNQK
ncbi:hypothetical protein [Desulfitobacterium sp. AusDCA]|uniref:hypothetical protein n=1 Tax=Desulfitobacterium sp. AusDCA TaxID=3240383 RepID=UPI003DA6E9F4